MKKYQRMIGDGKTPNKYWVFQYAQKYQRSKGDDGSTMIDIIKEDTETKNSLLGEFSTYEEALRCVDDKAYLPNVVIEDRLIGQIFEQLCIVCPCCGKEDYKTHSDIKYTKEKLAELGIEFK